MRSSITTLGMRLIGFHEIQVATSSGHENPPFAGAQKKSERAKALINVGEMRNRSTLLPSSRNEPSATDHVNRSRRLILFDDGASIILAP